MKITQQVLKAFISITQERMLLQQMLLIIYHVSPIYLDYPSIFRLVPKLHTRSLSTSRLTNNLHEFTIYLNSNTTKIFIFRNNWHRKLLQLTVDFDLLFHLSLYFYLKNHFLFYPLTS